MWEVCRDKVEAKGSKVVMETKVTRVRREGGRAVEVEAVSAGGGTTSYPVTDVISSMPFSQLLEAMDPPAPDDVLAAAAGLAYRDFLTVSLVVPADRVPWDDNWIYIHAPEVRTMRIQNFGSWSPYMVKDGKNVLGLEYTVWEGDKDWNAPDEELIERRQARARRARTSSKYDDVEAGYVVRQPKAYPIYDETYRPTSRSSGPGSTRTCRTSTPSGATACSATTTRTTRCSRPC